MKFFTLTELDLRESAGLIREMLTAALHGQCPDAAKLHLLTGQKSFIESAITHVIAKTQREPLPGGDKRGGTVAFLDLPILHQMTDAQLGAMFRRALEAGKK